MSVVQAHSSVLLDGGLLRRESGVEVYRVRGGGAIALNLCSGDRLTLINDEGRQPAEVAVFDESGRPDPAAIGAAADQTSEMLCRLQSQQDEQSRAVLTVLAARGIALDAVPAACGFGETSPPGDEQFWTSNRDVICLVAAPGEPMRVDQQNPPTSLTVRVKRAAPSDPDSPPDPPPPLAEPRLDLRVSRASALAYEVRQGEYIQVIDVAGRQCSDFLAFDAVQLQQGIERGLDATTTRTLMGAAYPRPGLYSKFFDQDMNPLVEIVRDTVGRHDTFNLACTAKYYADMGYPGHINCTDNFNTALEPYGVAPRAGWPAINFFYNTAIEADNAVSLDEPWSRPGDYVLMRASTDLVCSTSACPDDIDPANGWNPTDIHVRVYPADNQFSTGVAYRMTATSPARMTSETAFHPRTSALTRQFVDYRNYWLPTSFTGHGAIDEYYACRQRAVVMDLSPLRKFEVLGPDAEALMQSTVTRNVRKLAVGQVVYTAMCYDTGGMIDDGTIFRLGDNNFRWIGGDDVSGLWLREQAQARALNAWVRPSTDQLHNIAVQGPASRDVLAQVVWTPPTQPALRELTWFRFTIGRIADPRVVPILVSRTGYTGELGYEVWCHPSDALNVWDAVWEAGQPFGLTPLGLDALDILRIESGLIFAGYEFDNHVDPFEAGIGFVVPLKTKEDDFVGKSALMERKQHPQRRLVGLELEGNEPASHGDCVHVGRADVGVITSGTRSPMLSKNIALCRMAVQYAEPGTAVEVGKLDGRQKRIPARVVPFPFYDPQKKRPRS